MTGRTILLFLVLLAGVSLQAQDSINLTDNKGRKQGVWKKNDADGHRLYEGQFRDGVPYGEFRYFYRDGKLKTVSRISHEGHLARTVSYSENGRKIAEGNYIEEKKDSTWKYFSDYDGAVLSEENYSRGLKEGLSSTYYASGSVAETVNYRQGQKEGEWKQFYEDGKLKFRGSYSAGEKDGGFTAYFSSGKVSISGAYSKGHMDGPWTYYEENGKVSKQEKYSGGALVIEKQP